MKEICRVLGKFFLGLTVCLLIPLGVAVIYEYFLEPEFNVGATWAFLETMGISLAIGLLLKKVSPRAKGRLQRKESIFLVAVIWFITAAMGSLPFLFSGVLKNPIDAYFESMSGLTTTGVSILHPKAYDASGAEIPIIAENPIDPTIVYTFSGTVTPLRDKTGALLAEGLEALGKPLLFWRCFMEWIGGMGIVLLFIAILPALGMGGKMLFESEMSGVSKEGMTPRIRETASLLWKIYAGLTCVQIALLIFTNDRISLFDAVTLTFSTISTGGFTVHNNGIMGFQNSLTQAIIVIFMILGSLNFTLYFHTLRGKFYRLYEPEFYLYLIVLIGGCLLMSWNLWNTPQGLSNHYYSLTSALANGSFQAISALTSTGFFISNYDMWPYTCQLLILILMYIGGMSGSTTGGIKIARYVIILKVIKRKIETLFRPELVRIVKVGEREISDKMAITTLTFFCVVIAVVIIGSYLLIMDQNDPQTALGVISCMINNNSLLLGGTGAFGSFAFLTPFSKIVSIVSMALGRLEYFSLLVLFIPAFWKKT